MMKNNSSDRKSNIPFVLVIFGVTGNLAQLKLIPALYDLAEAGLLTTDINIVGLGRKKFNNDQFRHYITDVLHEPNPHHQHPVKKEIVDKLFRHIAYFPGDVSEREIYRDLNLYFDRNNSCSNKIYYLATYPDLYSGIFKNLESEGLNSEECGWVRVMIEKPIGSDLSSARKLNRLLSKYYVEDQIFRLDHYLGKETLQNILTFRFTNSVFEQLMHRRYIDHIQVTALEDFGIGLRGGYYDSVGALKDVGQNHILQMIALTTMDAPREYTNPAITQKRIELINSLVPDPDKIVFGQYRGYKSEKSVRPGSIADTYFAFRTFSRLPKLKDVPIYVRAGKFLSRTVTEVSVVFKDNTGGLFRSGSAANPNVLIYRIQPNEGIVLRFLTKVPGPELNLENEYMQFCYHDKNAALPDPYLRLLLDALRGDQTFFIDAPEVESQWKFTDHLFNHADRSHPEIYEPGSWGPKSADALIAADGRSWLEPSVAFCRL